MHNKEQDKAITFGTGPLLVLAGPGSGKTYVITHRILYLVSEKNIPPNDILVITFTKAAALEMQKRAISLNPICSHVQFGTFHSIFYHILKLSNPNQKYEFASDKERIDLLKNIIKSEHIVEKNVDIMQETEQCMKAISICKNNMIHDVNTNLPSKYKAVYSEYEAYMRENHKIDFDDMIKLCYELLKNNKEINQYWKNRFQYILVDEFDKAHIMV